MLKEEKADPNLLFVGGIPGKVKSDELRLFFSKYGEVLSLKLAKLKKKKKPDLKGSSTGSDILSQGHAYVRMKNREDAIELIQMKELKFESRSLRVELAVARSEKKKYKQEQEKLRVYIGNIPATTSTETLEAYFRQFGKLQKVYKIFDHGRQIDKDFGYVIYDNPASVKRVLEYEFHLVGLDYIRVAPFIPNHQKGKLKSYSDNCYRQNLVYDPQSPAHTSYLATDGYKRGELGLGTYNYHQPGESYYEEDSQKDPSIDPDSDKESSVKEFDEHPGPKFSLPQVKNREVKRGSGKQFKSLQRSNQKLVYPDLLASMRQSSISGSPGILKNAKFQADSQRRKDESKGRFIGRLSVVEEKRYKSQHHAKFNPRTNDLDQSLENYRLNILKRTRVLIPQLNTPPWIGVSEIRPTLSFMAKSPSKVLKEPPPFVEEGGSPLDDLEPKKLSQSKD